MRKVIIEFGVACTRCLDLSLVEWGSTLHTTTTDDCARATGHPCDYPEEHHAPRRRLILKVGRA